MLNISGISPVNQSRIVITYFFKHVNHTLASWDEIYFLHNLTPKSTSLAGGLFNDCQVGDENLIPVCTLIGAFIITIFILGVGVPTRSLSAGVFAGFVGLGISYSYGLLNNTLSLVSLIVLIILLIADGIGGNK